MVKVYLKIYELPYRDRQTPHVIFFWFMYPYFHCSVRLQVGNENLFIHYSFPRKGIQYLSEYQEEETWGKRRQKEIYVGNTTTNLQTFLNTINKKDKKTVISVLIPCLLTLITGGWLKIGNTKNQNQFSVHSCVKETRNYINILLKTTFTSSLSAEELFKEIQKYKETNA